MAMTVGEADAWYADLSELLRANGLTWILEEVEEQISLGQLGRSKLTVTETPVAIAEDDLFGERVEKRQTKATFLVSRPYSPNQRLRFLLEAIQIGIRDHIATARAVADYISGELDGAAVSFQPELESDQGFRLDRNALSDADAAAKRLDRVVEQLLEEVRDA
jgi:hypothetical protein